MKLPPLHPCALPAAPSHLSTGWRSERHIRMAAIQFEDGWDDADNSDVHAYTQALATKFLEDYSEDLSMAINSPRCNIVVKKGCHQAGDPHFTLSENRRGCSNKTYAGTRSVHIPCSA